MTTQRADRLRAIFSGPNALIMGIVNITPDSFSDGGHYFEVESAVDHGQRLIEQGADILDIGGESTRPGAEPVSVEEELERVIPVIERLVAKTETPVSVDSAKPEVMQAALLAGACMVNDVNGLREDGAIEQVRRAHAMACIMHMQGDPQSMQQGPHYTDVVDNVIDYLNERIKACEKVGIHRRDIVIDPGIGFGKNLQHNLSLLKAIGKIKARTKCDVLIGVSRKSMIDGILNRAVDERVSASVGLAVQAVINGAKIVRVHDVAATYDAVRCVEAVQSA